MTWVIVVSLLIAGFAAGVLCVVHADGLLRELLEPKRKLHKVIVRLNTTVDQQCREIVQLRDQNLKLIAARDAEVFIHRCIRATRKV